MHFIITDASLARSRAIHLSGTKLVLAALGLSLALMLMAAGMYHWVFLKGAREGWPVVGSLVRLVVRDVDDLERVHAQELTRIPGVVRVSSSIAMRTVVKRVELPL